MTTFKIFDPTTGERLLPMFVFSGTPDSTTFAGAARKNALLLDELHGLVYKNTGTQTTPVWVDISSILGENVSVGTITGTDDRESSSPTTGAFTTSGGVGIGKRLNVGGPIAGFDKQTTISAAGTDATTATKLTKQFNNVTTVGAATAGVMLPSAANGFPVYVWNNGANAMHVYAPGTETVDGNAGGTGVILTNANAAIFYPISSTAYLSMMGPKAS